MHSTTFWNEFKSREKKLSTKTEVKNDVMMPLMKLAKLTFPSWHHIFNNYILKYNFCPLKSSIYCMHLNKFSSGSRLKRSLRMNNANLIRIFVMKGTFVSLNFCGVPYMKCQSKCVIIWQADTRLNVMRDHVHITRVLESQRYHFVFCAWKKFLEIFRLKSVVPVYSLITLWVVLLVVLRSTFVSKAVFSFRIKKKIIKHK